MEGGKEEGGGVNIRMNRNMNGKRKGRGSGVNIKKDGQINVWKDERKRKGE